jgi:hypothetical protein
MHNLLYVVRRTIPVLYTLDGAVIYPQINRVELDTVANNPLLSVLFLGREDCFYDNADKMTGH